MPEYIYSDPKLLLKIKKQQYHQQVPALALLVLSFLIGFVLPSYNLRYVSLTISLAALIWYMYITNCFRLRQRIPKPSEGAVLSPLTGRIRYIKPSTEGSQLKIAKNPLDFVEIRCPHPSSQWEGDKLKLEYRGYTLVFRFEARQLVRYPDAPMEAGGIIGILVGAGSCYLNLPPNMQTNLKAGEICEAGFTQLLTSQE